MVEETRPVQVSEMGRKKKQEINSDRHLQTSNEHPRKQHTILTGKLWCKLGFLLFYMFRLLTLCELVAIIAEVKTPLWAIPVMGKGQ